MLPRFLLLSLVAPAFFLLSSTASAKRPHVLFIVLDDLGFDDVGFRSHEIKTPTIDGLAAKGIVLDSYYVQDVCSPSRATFQTGRYAMHHSIVDWIPPASAYGLPLNETTLADKMKSAGYATHAVGKWHLGFYKWAFTPTFRGFDSFLGFYSGGEDYFTHETAGGYDMRRDPSPRCGANCSQVLWQAQGTYSTTLFSEEAVRVVGAHDESEPLFLYLAYQGVHSPAEVPQSYIDPYASSIADPKRRKFAGMLSAVDEGIKNVTDALEAKGMLDDTFIVFTSDNGGPTTTGDGVGARNWPMRGGKHSIWEGGVRATGLVSGAMVPRHGSTYGGLMHGADWLPTLSKVAGFDLSNTLPLDGVSQWDAIISGGADGASPRSKVVLGNSTNECSWAVGDPRRARYEGLPEAQRLGCGFSIRENSGQSDGGSGPHWKLIQGYGGGPDTWCNSTSGKPSCWTPPSVSSVSSSSSSSCAMVTGTCFPGNDIKSFSSKTTTGADCCTACQANAKCQGWTHNKNVCYLKHTLGDSSNRSPDCISGNDGQTPIPSPAPAPSTTKCPSGWCLYDIATDPLEVHEVSAANPDVVKRMRQEMSDVLTTYTEYRIDDTCPPHKWVNDSHVGKVWGPWCG